MNAIILAAGWGSRLGGISNSIPKALLPLGRRRVLDIILRELDRPEIHTVNISHASRWSSAFRSWKENCMVRKYVKLHANGVLDIKNRIGSVGDLGLVIRRTSSRTPIFVCCGDNIFRFKDLSGEGSAITIRRFDGLSDSLKKSGFGRVSVRDGLVDKVTKVVGDHVFAGPFYLDEQAQEFLLEYCENSRKAGVLPDDLGDFISCLAMKQQVRVVLDEDKFLDIGTEAGLNEAREFYRK